MRDIIAFFQQYESVLYFILGSGIVFYGWRFYSAWQELRGSVFGLEQVNAQRRLNRSALAIFLMLIMGVGVFSLIAYVFPVIDTGAVTIPLLQENGVGSELDSTQSASGTGQTGENNSLATATPLPTVAIDPENCDIETIAITSPKPNDVVSGTVEVTGIINVKDFGFYVIEYAQASAELWNPIFSSRNLVPEEQTLLEWDTTFSPSGSYVIQLVVTNNDMTEYPACRIPIRIEN